MGPARLKEYLDKVVIAILSAIIALAAPSIGIIGFVIALLILWASAATYYLLRERSGKTKTLRTYYIPTDGLLWEVWIEKHPDRTEIRAKINGRPLCAYDFYSPF